MDILIQIKFCGANRDNFLSKLKKFYCETKRSFLLFFERSYIERKVSVMGLAQSLNNNNKGFWSVQTSEKYEMF